MDEQASAELAAHLAEPFPDSVERGALYGTVDPVLVDADVVGWASQPDLSQVQRQSLRDVADQLSRALELLPPGSVPYFQRLVRIARRAAAEA